jgi:hypothetical protein
MLLHLYIFMSESFPINRANDFIFYGISKNKTGNIYINHGFELRRSPPLAINLNP